MSIVKFGRRIDCGVCSDRETYLRIVTRIGNELPICQRCIENIALSAKTGIAQDLG